MDCKFKTLCIYAFLIQEYLKESILKIEYMRIVYII